MTKFAVLAGSFEGVALAFQVQPEFHRFLKANRPVTAIILALWFFLEVVVHHAVERSQNTKYMKKLKNLPGYRQRKN